MTQTLSPPKIRVDLVDALRGIALLGLLTWHSIERFCLFGPAESGPEFLRSVDPYVNETMRFICSGRPFTIFSLMFGFSFFVQMNNAKNKGTDFSGRFLWRLIILLAIAICISSIYIGQILTQYALLGIPLILLFRASSRVLLAVSIFFLLQIPTVIMFVMATLNPALKIEQGYIYSLWGEGIQLYATGSLLEVMEFNLWKGNIAIVGWAFLQGRIWQTFGLFVLGVFLAKNKFFENLDQHQRSIRTAMVISVVAFLVLLSVSWLLPGFGFSKPVFDFLSGIDKTFYNLASTFIIILAIIMVYPKIRNSRGYGYVVSYGRMALTNYVTQPIIAVPLFYGFGFGLYRYFGETLSLLLGTLILVAQIYFCHRWMKRFKYGPVEWVWRALTFMTTRIPFKRTDVEPAVYRKGRGQGARLGTEVASN